MLIIVFKNGIIQRQFHRKPILKMSLLFFWNNMGALLFCGIKRTVCQALINTKLNN